MFKSKTTKRVEAATDKRLLQPNPLANREVFELIRASKDGGKSVADAIKKRLKSKHEQSAVLAVQLLDACIRLGNRKFHYNVASEKFMKEYEKVLRNSKTGPRAIAMMLGLLNVLAEGFSLDDTILLREQMAVPSVPGGAGRPMSRSPYRAVYNLYERLLHAGTRFPDREQLGLEPLHRVTATPSQPSNRGGGGGGAGAGSGSGAPRNGGSGARRSGSGTTGGAKAGGKPHPYSYTSDAYVDKIKTDLQIVVTYMELLHEMLEVATTPAPKSAEEGEAGGENKSPSAPQDTQNEAKQALSVREVAMLRDGPASQLVTTLKDIRGRLARLCQEVERPDLLIPVLAIVDQVQLCLDWFETLVAGKPYSGQRTLKIPPSIFQLSTSKDEKKVTLDQEREQKQREQKAAAATDELDLFEEKTPSSAGAGAGAGANTSKPPVEEDPLESLFDGGATGSAPTNATPQAADSTSPGKTEKNDANATDEDDPFKALAESRHTPSSKPADPPTQKLPPLDSLNGTQSTVKSPSSVASATPDDLDELFGTQPAAETPSQPPQKQTTTATQDDPLDDIFGQSTPSKAPEDNDQAPPVPPRAVKVARNLALEHEKEMAEMESIFDDEELGGEGE